VSAGDKGGPGAVERCVTACALANKPLDPPASAAAGQRQRSTLEVACGEAPGFGRTPWTEALKEMVLGFRGSVGARTAVVDGRMLRAGVPWT
jgi:hypothetical protein